MVLLLNNQIRGILYLKAYELSNKRPKEEIEKFVLEKYWLSLEKFSAYKVKDGKVIDIINKETKLILTDEIDEVSFESFVS